MLHSIAEGIRKSRFFIVFLTAKYNGKIETGADVIEWCARELNYAAYRLSPKNLIIVVLEEQMKEKSCWSDPLLLLSASDVYFDFSNFDEYGDSFNETEVWLKLMKKLNSNRSV
jgi:hypothetical protein